MKPARLFGTWKIKINIIFFFTFQLQLNEAKVKTRLIGSLGFIVIAGVIWYKSKYAQILKLNIKAKYQTV